MCIFFCVHLEILPACFLFYFADAVLFIKILKVREEIHGSSEAELYNKMRI